MFWPIVQHGKRKRMKLSDFVNTNDAYKIPNNKNIGHIVKIDIEPNTKDERKTKNKKTEIPSRSRRRAVRARDSR
jgi:hypothetical protein